VGIDGTEKLLLFETCETTFGGFHKWGIPNSWLVYFMEFPIQMDDLTEQQFQEPPFFMIFEIWPLSLISLKIFTPFSQQIP